MKQVRPNCVEGKFYPENEKELINLIERKLKEELEKIDLTQASHPIIGGVVPHAGHVYCATEAVHFFEIVRFSKQEFDVVILINPSHRGNALPVSVDDHLFWSSPLGQIRIDRELAIETGLPLDRVAQAAEHSGEVVVPFIQYFMGNEIPLLPVNFSAQNNQNAQMLAEVLYAACQKLKRKPLIIASSDFNHFAAPMEGERLDDLALEALLAHDFEGFEKRIRDYDISICGFGAILALMHYARLKCGSFDIDILRRGHSGEVFPSNQVVDYISMLVYKNY